MDVSDSNSDTVNVKTILSSESTILYSGLTATSKEGKTVDFDSSTAEAIGPSGYDIDGDGTSEAPYVTQGELKIIDKSGNRDTLVSDDLYSSPDTDKTLMYVGQWRESDLSVFYVNEQEEIIYRVQEMELLTR